MRKVFFGLLALFITATTSLAEVEIPENKRVCNYDSGVCVWTSIENLGNIHGVKQLNGIAKYRHEKYGKVKYWSTGTYVIDGFGQWIQIESPRWVYVNEAPGTPERVKEELNKRGVKYKMQEYGNYDAGILIESVDKNLGCAVSLMNYPRGGDHHMVTLTDINKDKFVFLDNNNNKRIETTREWFNTHWTGYTVLIYPDTNK